MTLSESLIAELQREAPITRKLLARVPQDALAWKPHDKSMTLGRLSGHVAELVGILITILTRDELDFATGEFNPFVPAQVSDLLETFDKNASLTVELLKSQTDEQMLKPWRLKNGEQVFFEMSRVAALRLMTDHFIHH